MAGIVAQITKANWERKKNRIKHLNPDKCAYFLPPFDPCFDPKKHNVYMKRKALREKLEQVRVNEPKTEAIE